MKVRNYGMLWLALFVVASAYLTILFLGPVPVRDDFNRPVLVQSGKGADTSLVTGALQGQRGTPGPGAIDAEIRWLKAAVSDLRKRDDAIEERVGTIEKAFGPPTAALPREGEPRPSATHSVLGSAKPDIPVTVETQPLPQSGFADDLMAKSPLPVAGQSAPTRTLFAVELATATDRKTVAREWSELKKRHGALLANLEARIDKRETSGGGKTELRLIAGPFSNAADAAIACVRLRAAGALCAETSFTGEAL